MRTPKVARPHAATHETPGGYFRITLEGPEPDATVPVAELAALIQIHQKIATDLIGLMAPTLATIEERLGRLADQLQDEREGDHARR